MLEGVGGDYAAEGHGGGDLVVGDEEVRPGVFGGGGGLPAPGGGGAGFGEDDWIGHFGGAFGFAEIFAGFGFDNEVGFVHLFVLIVDFEFFLGGFDPFEDGWVVFKEDGEAAFSVGIEVLGLVEALFEAAKEHAADEEFFIDIGAEVAGLFVGGDAEGAGAEWAEAGDDVHMIGSCFLFEVVFLVHLAMDGFDERMLVVLKDVDDVLFGGEIGTQVLDHLAGEFV